MTVRVEGVLKTPINTLAANIPIKVVTIVGAGDIVPSAESVYMTDENGQYGFDLVYGTHNIYAMFIDTFEYIGTTVANESVPTPSTINELLEFSTPIQPEIVDQIYGDFDQCISDLESHWATCTNQLSEQVTQGDAGVIQQMTVYTNDCLCACSAELVTFMEAGDASILSEAQVYTDALGTEIATCTNQLNTDLAQISSTMTACTGANETAIATLRTDMQAGDAQIVQQATAYTDVCAGIVEADMINLVQACDAKVYTCMCAVTCCIELIETEATTVYRQDSAPADANPGDVWYETDNGNYPWFYTEEGNWVPLQDEEITKAIQDAANAQSTADGKIETFFQPTPPAVASEGDIWFDTDNGNKQYVYQTNQWVIAQDQGIGQAIADAAGAQATADGKVTTFYQDNPPSNSDAPAAIGHIEEGDLWIDTNDGNKLYRFTSGTWVKVQDAQIVDAYNNAATAINCADQALVNAAAAQSTADGKIKTYYQVDAPTTADEGDLWVDINDGNKQYMYVVDTWVPIQDSSIITAQNTANQAVNCADQALVDAATAQATADGKINTFYQDEEPTSGMGVGDIWIDTNDGNNQWIYTAGGWIDIQDKAISELETCTGDIVTCTAGLTGDIVVLQDDIIDVNKCIELQQSGYEIVTEAGDAKASISLLATSYSNTDVACSEILMAADKIAMHNGDPTNRSYPFVVEGDAVYMNHAYVNQLCGTCIESPDMCAGKITATTIESSDWAPDNTNLSPVGFKIFADYMGSVTLPDGTVVVNPKALAVFNDIVARGHITAKSLTFVNDDAIPNSIDNTCAVEDSKQYVDTGFVNNATYAADIADIQAQLDKSITSWFGNDTPTAFNYPANQWTTDAERDVHLGDLYYDNDDGLSYRWSVDNSVYLWIQVVDSGIEAALAAAAAAQDTADSKRRVFFAQPVPPYDRGDLWDTGEGLRRADVASTTNFSNSHWIWSSDAKGAADNAQLAAQNYADAQVAAEKVRADAYADGVATDAETAAIAAADAKAALAEQNAKIYADGEITQSEAQTKAAYEAYADAAENAAVVTANAYADGQVSAEEARAIADAQAKADLAEVTAKAYADGIVSEEEARAIADAQAKADAAEAAANGYTNSVASGLNSSITVAQNTADQAKVDAANAQSTADGKIDTYYQSTSPSNAEEGDIWVHTGRGNEQYIYSSGSWISIKDTGIAQAQTTAATAVNKADQAAIDAATAQSTADGKIRTWYQNNAPTSGMSEGDIWVDTDDGNNQWMYASGSWRDIQDQAIYAEASKAEAAAKAHADAKVAAEATRADAYADGIVTDAEEAAIAHADSIVAAEAIRADAYADGKADAAELAAIQAADAKAAAAEANAKAYADGEITASEAATTAAYRAYADAAEAAAVVTANAYADGELSQSEAEMTAAYKAYTDAAENAAIVTANAHADGIVTAEEQRAIADAQAKADAAEANAKAYTDSKASTILLNVTDSFYIPDESTAENGSKVFTFTMEQAGTVLLRLVQESTPSIRSINFRFNNEVQPTIFEEDFLVTLPANKGENVITLYDTSREVNPQAQVHLLTVTDITGNSAEEVVDNRIYPDQDSIQIKSSNYQTGVAGWAIDAAGTAEFLNLYARGLMESSTFRSGTIIGSTIYAVDTEELADPYWGTANAGTVIYYAYDSASPVAVNVPVSTVTENNPNNDSGAFATINFTDFEFYAAADNYTEYSQDRSKYPDIPANTLVGSYTFPTFTFGSTYYGTPFYRLYTTGNGTLRISFKETNGGEVSFVDVVFNPTVDTNKVVTLAGITFDVKIDSKYYPQSTGSYETGDNTHYYQSKGGYGLVISVKNRAGNFGSTTEETMNGKFSWGLNIPSPYINNHNGSLYTTVNHANYKMYARADISNEDR